MTNIKVKTLASQGEQDRRAAFYEQFKNNPIPDKEQLANVGLFMKRQDLTKVLFFNDLYQKIKKVHGVIMEFGVRWGQNLVTLNNLRGIHEPYNYSRKIIGFDTFSGFQNTNAKDGSADIIEEGAFSVTEGYESYLERILKYHESESPLAHIPKNTILKGDASQTLKQYLEDHPETIVAFAYFDFDIYQPTFDCLQLIKDRLTKGSIVGFDELNDPKFPGETLAVKEALGLDTYRIQRSPYSGMQSYIEIE